MTSRRFKCPGDAAFRRLLETCDCPTPFHVVRMRFLGEIASLDFAASPVKTIESVRGGDLPVFQGGEDPYPPTGPDATPPASNGFAERFAEAAERVKGPQRDQDGLSFEDHRRPLAARTRKTEILLTRLIGVSAALRSRRMAPASEIDDGIPNH